MQRVQCKRAQRCTAQNLPDVLFFWTRTRNQSRTVFVSAHFSLPRRELAPRFLMNSVATTFGILFPCCQLLTVNLYAAAESLAKYDTDISPAFPSQLSSFRSCFHSQLSTKSTILKVAHLLLIDYHALSSTFSGACRPNALADVASDRCNL